jgi:hypothetical protein
MTDLVFSQEQLNLRSQDPRRTRTGSATLHDEIVELVEGNLLTE